MITIHHADSNTNIITKYIWGSNLFSRTALVLDTYWIQKCSHMIILILVCYFGTPSDSMLHGGLGTTTRSWIFFLLAWTLGSKFATLLQPADIWSKDTACASTIVCCQDGKQSYRIVQCASKTQSSLSCAYLGAKPAETQKLHDIFIILRFQEVFHKAMYFSVCFCFLQNFSATWWQDSISRLADGGWKREGILANHCVFSSRKRHQIESAT